MELRLFIAGALFAILLIMLGVILTIDEKKDAAPQKHASFITLTKKELSK